MPPTIHLPSNPTPRTQILSNLSFLGFTPRGTYDIILSKTHNLYYAWVVHLTPNEKQKLIIKGPPALTCEGALEMLLEVTAEMVEEEMGGYVEEFERSLSRMVGKGGFALEGEPRRSEGKGGEMEVEVNETKGGAKTLGVGKVDSLFGEPVGPHAEQAAEAQMEAIAKVEAEKQRVKKSLEALEAMMEEN